MSDSAVSIPNPVVSGVQKKDADYVFYELTRSICPNRKRVTDARHVSGIVNFGALIV
jgi:hypothetical protein